MDIFDAKVLNFGVEFSVGVDPRYDTTVVLITAINKVKQKFSSVFEIGESIYINDIWTSLIKTEGVLEVKKIKVFNKNSGVYSTYKVDFDKLLSKDGTIIIPPKNAIFELKLPNIDIKGIAK